MTKGTTRPVPKHPGRELLIGIDVGGTTILAVLIEPGGTVLYRKPIPVDRTARYNLPETLSSLIKELITGATDCPGKVTGIGIGITSILDQNRDKILFSPSYPHYKGLPLKTILENSLKRPIVLENDLNAAAWGERCFGNGRPFSNFYMIMIGTGCGGSFVYQNEIYGGLSGTSLVGHVTLIPEGGPLCTCGNTGCVQSVVSGTAIARRAREMLQTGKSIKFPSRMKQSEITSKDVFAAASAGDPVALEIVNEVGSACGLVVANIIHLLNPEAVIIGGGVAQAGAILLNRVRDSAMRRLLVETEFECQILPAGLGSDATVLGAAMLAAHRNIKKLS